MKAHFRLKNMLNKIDDIEYYISQKDGKVFLALSDRVLKPAIRMQIITLSEEFSKLIQDGEYEILANFDKNDIKGLNAVRNFIAHDYDSVDDEILEVVIRNHLPKLKSTLLKLTD